MSHRAVFLTLLCAVPRMMRAQEPFAPFAGSELESYRRALQVTGAVAPYPWTIRGFGDPEWRRLAPAGGHPWAGRAPSREASVRPILPSLALVVNTGEPFGRNDGPVWAGRGVTVAVQGGLSLRAGPLSLSLAPVLFATSNADFQLLPNGYRGDTVFASSLGPLGIDHPQRFGPDAFAELRPGESTVRVDLGPVAFGLSTAGQVWGPAVFMPLVLGTNGGGYPHGFAGTARPINIGIGRAHLRVVWGRLTGSAWNFADTVGGLRYAPGLVAVFMPRGLRGLELGGSRFFHTAWPAGGLSLSDLGKPFEPPFKKGLATDSNASGGNPDDQLASVFARWTFPESGFEAYAEFGRADHNWNITDFVLEPDISAALLAGVARVWQRPGGALLVLRAEVANAQRSQLFLFRNQPIWYRHAEQAGHSYRGQLLGSEAILGGAGTMVRLDYYDGSGRRGIFVSRELVRQQGRYLATGVENARGLDVMYIAGVERLRFGEPFNYLVGVTAVQRFNRGFRRDAFNLNMVMRVSLASRRPQTADPAASR